MAVSYCVLFGLTLSAVWVGINSLLSRTISTPEIIGLCLVSSLFACLIARRERIAIRKANNEIASYEALSPDSTTHRFMFPDSGYTLTHTNRMVVWLHIDLTIRYATPTFGELLSRENQSLSGSCILDLVHPEDAKPLGDALRNALKDGEVHDIVTRIVTPLGEGHYQLDVMVGCDDAGKAVDIRCHFLDITPRIRKELELCQITNELRQSNARLSQQNQEMDRLKESYRDLYHNAPVMYFSLDIEGKIVAINDGFLRMMGYKREDLMNKPYELLLTEEGKAALMIDPTMMQRAENVETQWLRADGRTIDVWIGTTTIRDASGVFLRSRSIARDVTEENRLANDLHTKADELMHANQALRRINQELEEFSYVVSHDLKEPLRTLEAFSNFLAADYRPLLQGDGQMYIDHLVQASLRLGRLIDDLLALSRNGRVIDSPRLFDWYAVIETVQLDLQDLISRKGAVVRIEGEMAPCMGDPERITQLLQNLVSNALRYNLGSAPEVVIGSIRKNATETTIFVRDNGIGIDPQHHQQIFRMFRRLHRREEIEGTGAGLAICKRIVEAHGGRIWVESQLGRGSTFFFTLRTDLHATKKSQMEFKTDAMAFAR
ncbi:MAG: PAS domain S-box protein [Planctomycetia bacterium]|nr:PAS domain S-box protein [Planctomycetia bacterium]